ncbi:MAG TPA: hypothetical protein VJZ50_09610, partial [Candidatus Limnocylindrales bacterium]|nr:hypothetical protein [Candidatus Limnocylindrales bacterium]
MRWLALALAALAGVVVAAWLVGPRLGGTSASPSFVPSASASAPHDGSPTAIPSLSSSPTPLPNHVSLPVPTWDPGVGTLVLRLWMEAPLRAHLLTLLEDGHVITTNYPHGAPEGPNEGSAVERRLTPAGVQLVRDELDATGLSFLASADYYPDGPWDGTPNSLEVAPSEGGAAVINWRSGAVGSEVEALRTLESRLLTLEEWLPASAWADANARAYAAARYVILIRSTPWGGNPDDLPVESTTVSWPLNNGIDDYGDAVEVVNQEGDANGEGPGRCRVVSVEEAAPVVGALEAAGATLDDPLNGIRFSLGARAAGRLV